MKQFKVGEKVRVGKNQAVILDRNGDAYRILIPGRSSFIMRNISGEIQIDSLRSHDYVRCDYLDCLRDFPPEIVPEIVSHGSFNTYYCSKYCKNRSMELRSYLYPYYVKSVV
jgi:hypothetical protein